jgi:hypothetical protein
LQAEEDIVTERHMGDDVLVAMRNLSRKMCQVMEDRNNSEGLEYWSMRAAAYQREVERRGLKAVSGSEVP